MGRGGLQGGMNGQSSRVYREEAEKAEKVWERRTGLPPELLVVGSGKVHPMRGCMTHAPSQAMRPCFSPR